MSTTPKEMVSSFLKPECPGSNGPIYSLPAGYPSPVVYSLPSGVEKTIKAESLHYFVQTEANARYRIASRESLVLWRQYNNDWQQETELNAEYLHVDVQEQDIIAIATKDHDANLTISRIDSPRLLIEQFYGANLSEVLPLPGQPLIVVIDVPNIFEGESLPDAKPRAFFDYADRDSDTVFVDIHIADEKTYSLLDIESPYRHVMHLEIPKVLSSGWGRLTIEWGELSSEPVSIEITTASLMNIRHTFAQENLVRIQEYIGPDTQLFGYYNPLPQNAIIAHGLSNDVVTELPNGDWLLYFAYNRQAFFHQHKTLWIMFNIQTGETIEYETTDWPDVLDSEQVLEQNTINNTSDENPQPVFCGCGIGPQDDRESGYHDVQPLDIDKLIKEGGFFKKRPLSPAPEPLPKKQVIRPGAFLEENKDCPVIRKIAILLQFDDNTTPYNKDGKSIPNFDKVINKEKDIVRELGCEPIIVLTPDDFTPKQKQSFERPTKGKFNSLEIIKKTIKAQITAQKDCCYELLIFINAHQNKENTLIYSNKKKGVNGTISLPLLCALMAEVIRNSSDQLSPSCPAASEIIVHSCYSGRFASQGFYDTNDAGTGVTASSDGKQTSKGTPGYYYFLEALHECIKEHPEKTLTDIFECIVKKTQELARIGGVQQTPKRKPPTRKK